MGNPYWPLFDLELKTDRLSLRLPTDEELPLLASLIGDIHDPERMPFSVPWTRGESPHRERALLRHHWDLRSRLMPEDWALEFGVWMAGELVGSQRIVAKDFSTARSIRTGSSWVARSHQGKGIGKEMRAAVLFFAFDTLGALAAHTDAFDWNLASITVTKKLGYEFNGEELLSIEGKQTRKEHFRLSRQSWEQSSLELYDVKVAGEAECLEMLGADDATKPLRPAERQTGVASR